MSFVFVEMLFRISLDHIRISCTAKHANYEEEKIAKDKYDFLALVSWYYGTSHQYRDKFDLKTRVEGPN